MDTFWYWYNKGVQWKFVIYLVFTLISAVASVTMDRTLAAYIDENAGGPYTLRTRSFWAGKPLGVFIITFSTMMVISLMMDRYGGIRGSLFFFRHQQEASRLPSRLSDEG